jgi:acyl-CoA dehydrogenase
MSATISAPHVGSVGFTADHDTLRRSVRQFVDKEVAPHVTDWDEAGSFPRSLYSRVAELGLLGLGYPEELGGTEADLFMRLVVTQEFARAGSGGLCASLFSHNIGLPPVVAKGSAELQQRVVPPVLRGERISALAITEPGGGSDVAALRTTAVRDGADYVVHGEKVFITSGMRADVITLAVRTDPANKGAGGVSLLLVEVPPEGLPGLSRTELKKTGWWMSDTAHLRFDGMRVPASNLIGAEGKGFRAIMENFNGERLMMSALATSFAQVCVDEALDWARQRSTFGAPLIERQVIRHKLVDMQMRVNASEAWLVSLCQRIEAGDVSPGLVADLCMLKNHSTQAMQFCADQAVQVLGGMGFMRGTKTERIYREVKVMMIGGGAEEIMKELAAKQLGF